MWQRLEMRATLGIPELDGRIIAPLASRLPSGANATL